MDILFSDEKENDVECVEVEIQKLTSNSNLDNIGVIEPKSEKDSKTEANTSATPIDNNDCAPLSTFQWILLIPMSIVWF